MLLMILDYVACDWSQNVSNRFRHVFHRSTRWIMSRSLGFFSEFTRIESTLCDASLHEDLGDTLMSIFVSFSTDIVSSLTFVYLSRSSTSRVPFFYPKLSQHLRFQN